MTTKSSSIIIAAVQPHLRPNDTDPMSAALHVIKLMREESKENDIDLFVLPELCPLGYSQDTFDRYLPNDLANVNMLKKIDELLCGCAKVSFEIEQTPYL